MPLLSRSLTTVASIAIREFNASASIGAHIKNVTIIGAGLMGAGIAQVSAQANVNVTLVDQSDEILKKGHGSIDKNLRKVAKKKFAQDEQAQESMVTNVLKYVTTTTDIPKAVKEADLVIEAIVENLEIKQKLFEQIESAAPSHAILATNTSSLRLSDVSSKLKRKENFGGLHFFNPVPRMKLVEVVRSKETSDETFESLLHFGKEVGKETVCCKDTPGFIVNRLLVPYLFEAFRLFERGDARMADIDTAMKLGAGYPMGPFELADYIGLDTCKFIFDGWHKAYPNEPLFRPCEMFDELVASGKHGKKNGEGFYKYGER